MNSSTIVISTYNFCSQIVDLVKTKSKKLCLSIGDGANDVTMIRQANVGVGITGLEGRQASMAADFSVARFRHLVRLLFVHGHWTYDRLAVMTLYNFFKNSVSIITNRNHSIQEQTTLPSTHFLLISVSLFVEFDICVVLVSDILYVLRAESYRPDISNSVPSTLHKLTSSSPRNTRPRFTC